MNDMGADKKPGIFKNLKMKAAAVLNVVSNDLTTDAVPDRSHQIKAKPELSTENLSSLNIENDIDDLKRSNSTNLPKPPGKEPADEYDSDCSKALKEPVKNKKFFGGGFKNRKKKDKFEKSHYNYTATSNVYNVTGNGIHIGPSYSQEIVINGNKNTNKRSTVNVTQEIKDIMDNTEPLTKDHLLIVSPIIGDNWKYVGRLLGYCDGQLEQIQADNPYQKERVYQMLLDWTRNDPDRAVLSILCRVLWRANEEQAVEKLALFVYSVDRQKDYDDMEKFDIS